MIHKYSQNGYNIVLDVNSGAVHVVDQIVFDMLDFIKPPITENCDVSAFSALSSKYSEKELTDAYAEIYELYKNEVLFTEDDYEQYANFSVKSPIKSMCLHIAHDCNLRCKYCFASTGDFGHGRLLMPLDVAKKAIDFLIEKSVGRRNLELDFFGGEPLMNIDVVKEVVKYAREQEKIHNKNFRFTTTTNGVLLNDEIADYLNSEMANIVLSHDGRKEVNDTMRETVNKKGSYDIITPKFQSMVEKRGDKEYYVRGTFTKNNLDFEKDVLHLYELGFDQISVEPVVTDSKYDYALTEDDLPKIFEEYEHLAKTIIEYRKAGKFFNFFHFMIDLDHGPCAIKRMKGCGCGNEYVAITPDGDIYPCHQFVGNEEWKMGNILTGEFDNAKKDLFSRAHIYNKPECKECWAKFYCSGGCNANNALYNKDVLKPLKLSCELEKKRVECAIMIKAALAEW